MHKLGRKNVKELIALGRMCCIAREKCKSEGIPYMNDLTSGTGYDRTSLTRIMWIAERVSDDNADLIADMPVAQLYAWVSPSVSDAQLQDAFAQLAAGTEPKQITAELKAAREPSKRKPRTPKTEPEQTPVVAAPEPIEAEYRPVTHRNEPPQPVVAASSPSPSTTSLERAAADTIRKAIAASKSFSFNLMMQYLQDEVGTTGANRVANSFADKLAKAANG